MLTNEYWKVTHINAAVIKELDPQNITLISGGYTTVSYKGIHKQSVFDSVCIGDCEQVFP